MTRQDLKHYQPGALDPLVHNRIVARRKRFRRIARDFRRSGLARNRSFRDLARAADHAADSLRHLNRAFAAVGVAR
jgi:hypothetical protein